MSTEITAAFVQEYTDGIRLLSQQKASRLRKAVMEETITGENAYFDQVGVTQPQLVTSRHADTVYTDTPHARRYVALKDYDLSDLVDKEDEIRVLNRPTSKYQQAFAAGFNRQIDDDIIAAFDATAKTGKTGSGSEAWDTDFDTTSVAIASLTYTYLLEAKQLLWTAEGIDPDDELFFACSGKSLVQLLQDPEVQSSDFNTVRALVNGEIDQFAGFTFIRTERLPGVGTSAHYNYAWAKSGMMLAIGRDITGRIDELPTKRYSTQVYACMSIGVTRMEQAKVVRVLIDDS